MTLRTRHLLLFLSVFIYMAALAIGAARRDPLMAYSAIVFIGTAAWVAGMWAGLGAMAATLPINGLFFVYCFGGWEAFTITFNPGGRGSQLLLALALSRIRLVEDRLAKREKQLSARILDLQQTLARVRELTGLLPICANCKSIRDDQGYWKKLESYLTQHSKAQFSHGLCPECVEKLYADYMPALDGNTAATVTKTA